MQEGKHYCLVCSNTENVQCYSCCLTKEQNFITTENFANYSIAHWHIQVSVDFIFLIFNSYFVFEGLNFISHTQYIWRWV